MKRLYLILFSLMVFSALSWADDGRSGDWYAKYYVNAHFSDPAPAEDWFAEDFDDSGWKTVHGPIGNAGWVNCNTPVPEHSSYFVRRTFTLYSLKSDYKIYLAHDDGATLYVNGIKHYTSAQYNGQIWEEINVPSSDLHLGDNVIAVTVNDDGGDITCLDFYLTSSDSPSTTLYQGLYYELNSDNMTATLIPSQNGVSYSGDIIVPDEVRDSRNRPYNVITIGTCAFKGCSGVTSLSLPSQLERIDDQAFEGCSSLTEVSIPGSISHIGRHAFQDCTSLTTANFLSSIDISDYMFSGCSALKTVNFRRTPTFSTVGAHAFCGCTSLVLTNNHPLASTNITTIGPSAFEGCSGITQLSFSQCLQTVGNAAFKGCTELTSLRICGSVNQMGDEAFSGCTSLASLTITGSVAQIGSSAFRNCTSLTNATLGNTLETLGNSVFQGCIRLANIILPPTIKQIGTSVFEGCSVLNTADLGGSYTVLPARTFASCENLSSVVFPTSLTTVDAEAFVGCSALAELTIPSGVRQFAPTALSDCANLRRLTFAAGATTICPTYATHVAQVELPASARTIDDRAFEGWTSLVSVNLQNITNIGNDAFSGCSTLQTAKLTSIQRIGERAFTDCAALSSLTLGANLTTIGLRAFKGCGSIATLTLPGSLKQMGTEAFAGCDALTALEYGEGTTTALRTYSTNITELTLPTTCARIEEGAFAGCSTLSRINIGSLEMWNMIFHNSRHNPFSCLHTLYLEGQPLTNLIADFGAPVASYAFAGCKGLRSVTLMNSIHDVCANSFAGCPDLETVVIGDAVRSIGANAFRECTNLQFIRIGNSVTTIDDEAFLNCSALTSVKLGKSVEHIGAMAFYGCRSIDIIELPATMRSFGESSFAQCSHLKTINLPEGITELPRDLFALCVELDGICLPASITKVGRGVFWHDASLSSIEMSDNVQEIGEFAFEACTKLRSISIGTGLKKIGERAFVDCGTAIADFIIAALDVPLTSADAFAGSDPGNIFLWVPDESVANYAAAAPWSSMIRKQISSKPVYAERIKLSCTDLVLDIDNPDDYELGRTITATVEPANATMKDVRWTFSNTNLVDSNVRGNSCTVYTTGDRREGTVAITCSAKDGNGAESTAYVKVCRGFVPVTAVSLDACSLALTEGDTHYLTSTILPANATYYSAKWSSSDSRVATVDDLGVVTALKAGHCTISCMSEDGTGVGASCEVSVSEPRYATLANVGDVNFDNDVSCADIEALVNLLLGRDGGYDHAAADINKDGHVGIADIAAIVTALNTGIPLPAGPLQYMGLDKTELELQLGEQQTLHPMFVPYRKRLPVAWASDDETVATVAPDGIVTAVGYGRAVITATTAGQRAECLIVVPNPHPYVDLGLPSGTLWATTNVGAETPEQFGEYFAWGEVRPKEQYTWNTYSYCNGSSKFLTKYCLDGNYGEVDNRRELLPEDDAATVNWGKIWKTPSPEQMSELLDNRYTHVEYITTQNGILGARVTSRINGNSIFLPATGSMLEGGPKWVNEGVHYWTNTYNGSYTGIDMAYGNPPRIGGTSRCDGIGIRPVMQSHIVLSSNTVTLFRSEQHALAADLSLINQKDIAISWSSSNPGVASVDANGLITAQAPGEAHIYATVTVRQQTFTAYCHVVVMPEGRRFTVNGVTFYVSAVDGGTFRMGTTSGKDGDEKPVHNVTLSSYYMGTSEVTQALWTAVMGSRSDWTVEYGLGDTYPAYNMSWNECQEFISRLNTLTGERFRMPTEAEWEYAARGGNKSQGYLYSGSNNIQEVAWSWGSNMAHPVATLKPNELGIYDMSGNVWEWCSDWFAYYSSSSVTNPKGPASGTYRIGRGGGWIHGAIACTVYDRYNHLNSNGREITLGLRLVLER